MRRFCAAHTYSRLDGMVSLYTSRTHGRRREVSSCYDNLLLRPRCVATVRCVRATVCCEKRRNADACLWTNTKKEKIVDVVRVSGSAMVMLRYNVPTAIIVYSPRMRVMSRLDIVGWLSPDVHSKDVCRKNAACKDEKRKRNKYYIPTLYSAKQCAGWKSCTIVSCRLMNMIIINTVLWSNALLRQLQVFQCL